ncbi:3-oxoacyl-[acyl-carrier-protein] reductase FabG [Chlamydiales bacterium SCGC AB-751-O23]|jgi:3-oxoacyl-[acyl-carrier protein] reductase|nr:3-oxoacyl-[acyl-carrier-protein] reductase FabG [Chlamydiales bacterium SCGC AB-751-O23]
MAKLDKQVALVTGGTSGIGRACCFTFAKEGAKVLIFGSNQERGDKVISDLKKEFPDGDFVFYRVDVSKTDLVQETIDQILKDHERVDILLNCAGITRDQLFLKMDEKSWDDVIEVNLKSVYNTCKALTRPMMKQRKGRVINISSVVGIQGNAGQANYAASKAGMHGFTKSLARELARRGITCNCIAPGFIETKMTTHFNENQKKEIEDQIPLRRMGSPEDIAACALYLASDDASYITGQVLVVDGGISM